MEETVVKKRKYGKKRVLKKWEKAMPKPPGSEKVVREMLLSHISYLTPKTIPELHWEMQNDYGSICSRTIHRHMAYFKDKGMIETVGTLNDFDGYRRRSRFRRGKLDSVISCL